MADNNIDIISAVRAMSDLNPDENAEAEAELLALMTDAGKARCERSIDKIVIRPRSTDLFENTAGLPEIHATQLNRDTLAAGILHHGALLVRQLYSDDLVTRLQAIAASGEDIDREDHSPLGCSPHTFFALLNIYHECGLLDALRGYLDDEPVVFAQRSKLRQHRAERSGINMRQYPGTRTSIFLVASPMQLTAGLRSLPAEMITRGSILCLSAQISGMAGTVMMVLPR